MKRLLLAVALWALAGSSCIDNGGAPHLLVRYDPSNFDSASLFWTHPNGAAGGGFAIEGRPGSGPFEVLQKADAWSGSAVYRFGPDGPEVTEVQFLVRALPDEDRSRASNVVSIRRGLRPPVLSCTPGPLGCAFANGGVQLEWTNLSRAADGFSLERRVSEAGKFFVDPDKGWTSIATVTAAAYLDADIANLVDGAAFAYRVVAVKGPERSLLSNVRSAQSKLLAPEVVSATALPDDAPRITFRNMSTAARSMRIVKTPIRPTRLPSVLSEFAAPAPGTTKVFFDSFAGPGIIEYSLEALMSICCSSGVDSATTIALTVPPRGFTTTYVSIPPGTAAVRTASGDFGSAGGLRPDAVGPSFLIAPGGAAAAAHQLPDGASLWRPGIALDPAGHPHAVHAEPVSGTPDTALIHSWHDGQAWQREEIARRSSVARVRFDVGIDGTLHASWSSPTSLEAARLANGTWTIEDVGTALGATFQAGWPNHFLVGDENGGAQIVAITSPSGDPALRIFRDAAGWHAETVPNGPFPIRDDRIRLVAQRGAAAVAFERPDGGSVGLVVRTSAAWQVLSDLATFGASRTATVDAARSPDGTQVAFTVDLSDGTAFVFVSPAALTFLSYKDWFDPGRHHSVGFRPDGKVWILGGLEDAAGSDGLVRALLFEEP